MSMTIENKRRELFEANERDRDRTVSAKFCGQYVCENQQERWLDWNAAMDAVEIPIPDLASENDGNSYSVMQAIARNQALDEVRASIESTGLGLKVLP